MSKKYTAVEKKSLKFYQGDDKVVADGILTEFYSISKAYLMLNSLMYGDIRNEYIRIDEEGKYLNPELLYYIEEILKVYTNIFTIMKKYHIERKQIIKTYRLDRAHSLECFKMGRLISFTSTTKNITFDKEYFQKKAGLVIFDFIIDVDIPCVDVNEVLGEKTRYSNQNEVLLPPFIPISMKEVSLNEKEKTYRDINNNPPIGKFEITLLKEKGRENIIENKADLMKFLTDKKNIDNAVSVINKMNSHIEIEEKSISSYIEWKKCFQKLIRIYYEEVFEN